jgi:hypothetical protein
MTTRPFDDLLHIVRNGGSLDFQAENLSRENLVQLAANTQEKAIVILRGLNTRSTDELLQISRNGKGAVIIVLD